MIKSFKLSCFVFVALLLCMVLTTPVIAAGETVLSVEVTGNEQIRTTRSYGDYQYPFGNPSTNMPCNRISRLMNLGYFTLVEPYAEEFLGGLRLSFAWWRTQD